MDQLSSTFCCRCTHSSGSRNVQQSGMIKDGRRRNGKEYRKGIKKTMLLSILSFITIFVTIIPGIRGNLPPVFVTSIDNSSVAENTPVGTVIGTLKATDPENSRLTYGLQGSSLFRVDARSGIVSVNSLLDREKVGDVIHLNISVEDYAGSGKENHIVKVPVAILIIDENDNSPKFISPVNERIGMKIKLSEDTPIGSTIINKLEVTDPDLTGSTLKVSCESCGTKFKVDPTNDRNIDNIEYRNPGSRTTLSSTNNYLAISVMLMETVEFRVDRPKEEFKLIVTDGKYNTTLSVEVTIVDVQNKPPVFIGSTSAIIPEDSPIGSLVVKLRAIDGDSMSVDALSHSSNVKSGIGRAINYEIIQAPNDWFSINAMNGEIRVANKLDKEAFPSTNGMITLKIKAIEVDDLSNKPDPDPLSSTIVSVTITLQDVNDEVPKPNKNEFFVSVLEGVPNGTPLSGLDMIFEDRDSGSNSVFNLALIDHSGIFSIEPLVATGSTAVSIRVSNGPFDYENPLQRKFILVVNATETFSKEKLSSIATVTVTVQDVNDNRPQFQQDHFTATVVEDSMPGTIVASIKATDRDSPAITNLEYSLFGNGAELFNVNPTTGVITVADCPNPGSDNCIDYETRQSYYMSFQASDGFGQSSVVPLSIQVTDANDNVPHFIRDKYTATIDEGSLKFEPPLRVKASDADVTSAITYSITDGNTENLFAIESRSGEIKVNQPVRSKSEQVVLKVSASDGGKGITTTSIVITIRDSNDNAPIFDRTSYFATVSETAPPSTFVESVHATDADSGLNAQIEYRIIRGAFDEFVINNNTGMLYLSPAGHTCLDFDRRSSYEIEIAAIDKGVPSKTGVTTLIVKVINHNDKSPYFIPTTQRTQISENIEVGSRFYKVQAYDPDTESETSLSFRIVGVSAIDKEGQPMDQSHPKMAIVNNFFAVERITGELMVNSKINRDIAAVVSLNLSVTDVSSSSMYPQVAYGSVIITVIDHNDNPPIFGKPWTSENPELSVTTLEEQPVGTVLINLLATDPDSDIARYEINPPSPYFEIGPKSGVVTIKRIIDYETIVRESPLELDLRTPKLPNQLRFNVIAYDSGIPQLSAMVTIHVNVVNINDNEPVFNQSSYRASIKENIGAGAYVAQVKATDADYGKYGKISYSIISISGNGNEDGINNYFVISNDTGVIRVGPHAKIDREKGPRKLTLQVAASDDMDISTKYSIMTFGSSTGRRMISVPIYITIEDVNDNKPTFSLKEYEATTLGHADGSSNQIPVIQVTAADPDDGVNGAVAYRIVSGNLNDVFEIDSFSGLISAIKSPLTVNPDVNEYRIKVEARDENGDGPFIDEAVVKVKVIQVNRHKPKFIFPSTPFVEIFENSKPGSKVVRVQAFDEDPGYNGVVKCSFKVNGSNVQETNEFKIDPDTGLITTKKSLDAEAVTKYELVLLANDFMGEPQSFETLQQLTIIVKDVDDNKAEFPRSKNIPETYVFSISENSERGAVIGHVTATDQDVAEENRKTFYHIIDGNSDLLFHVDKVTGVLYANVSFDREVNEEYELVIKASSKEHFSHYYRGVDEPDIMSTLGVRERSYNPGDLSLAFVVVRILDVNDNKPVFPKSIYRCGISYKSDIGSVVKNVGAIDPDAGINSSLAYTITSIDLFRRGYDTPDSPVRPIPSPFIITSDGVVEAVQLMSQYPVGSRFVLNLEAKEKAMPFRSTTSKLYIWIHDPQKLLKMTIKMKPEMVHLKSDEIETMISSATEYRAIIHEIKYHFDFRKNRIVKEWSDLFVLVVDDRTFGEVAPQRVIAKLDSNSHLHLNKPITIEQVALATANPVVEPEELDATAVIFFILVVLMCIGFISMGISYCCLRSWYHQKFIEKSRKSAAKAKIQAMKDHESVIMSGIDPEGTLRSNPDELQNELGMSTGRRTSRRGVNGQDGSRLGITRSPV